MDTLKNNPGQPSNRERLLEQENAELKKRLHEAESDRDAYRTMVHAWAKERITPEQLKEWDRIDEDSGRTILDVIAEIRSSRA